ncbi:SIR2 family protein [Catellatospora coxensis]
MDDLLATRRPVFDARISLATAVHAQPGVYALLLGSGTSTAVGVPTGWGVVTALVAKVAAAAGETAPTDAELEQWWTKHGDGAPLGYSALLESLASTPAARRALLASFFEPSAEERQQGIKVPGAAHRAIAALVARGAVRVIVTTNFDRLIEQALEAEGIFPQVIASPAAIEGMEPLPHARCTVIKLHGDYARTDQLNTVEELSAYRAPWQRLLERVLDEYGLIVNGWSGDWDHGLVAALEGTRSRRYPLFWASRGELGQIAKRLVAQHRAHVITGAAAEQFFPDLVNRLEALDDLADPPLTKAMAVARLKRLLPDPVKHIEVADLFDTEIRRLRDYLRTTPPTPSAPDPAAAQRVHDDVRARCDTLMRLLAHGVYLDRDRQHTALWVRVIEQLMRARHRPEGEPDPRWAGLQHYPALLALKTASLAAVASYHDDVLLRLLRRPTWRIRAATGTGRSPRWTRCTTAGCSTSTPSTRSPLARRHLAVPAEPPAARGDHAGAAAAGRRRGLVPAALPPHRIPHRAGAVAVRGERRAGTGGGRVRRGLAVGGGRDAVLGDGLPGERRPRHLGAHAAWPPRRRGVRPQTGRAGSAAAHSGGVTALVTTGGPTPRARLPVRR